jgi:hypothetical protein
MTAVLVQKVEVLILVVMIWIMTSSSTMVITMCLSNNYLCVINMFLHVNVK